MSEPYGMHVEFTARPGRANELERLLLDTAHRMGDVRECTIYMVSRSPDHPETICVTEAWSSREAHELSLQEPATQALIERTRELMAGPPRASVLHPTGGKGI